MMDKCIKKKTKKNIFFFVQLKSSSIQIVGESKQIEGHRSMRCFRISLYQLFFIGCNFIGKLFGNGMIFKSEKNKVKRETNSRYFYHQIVRK